MEMWMRQLGEEVHVVCGLMGPSPAWALGDRTTRLGPELAISIGPMTSIGGIRCPTPPSPPSASFLSLHLQYAFVVTPLAATDVVVVVTTASFRLNINKT
uniref:Uncharacterized protein n=1 Tax=Oryza rufipogon TaxID=4529 RepID=A0A0E0REB0_ORYRU